MVELKAHMTPGRELDHHFFMVVISPDERDPIENWCHDNLKGYFKFITSPAVNNDIGFSIAIYENQDAMLFKMSWS